MQQDIDYIFDLEVREHPHRDVSEKEITTTTDSARETMNFFSAHRTGIIWALNRLYHGEARLIRPEISELNGKKYLTAIQIETCRSYNRFRSKGDDKTAMSSLFKFSTKDKRSFGS